MKNLDADLEGLLFAHIEEQALMREAKRLGLDEDDTIIRRRLAQKMRFMIDDIGSPELPPREDLQIWFEANPERFIRPETRSFEHIFLSPKGRSDTVFADAEALLKNSTICASQKPQQVNSTLLGSNPLYPANVYVSGPHFLKIAPKQTRVWTAAAILWRSVSKSLAICGRALCLYRDSKTP